MGSANRIPVYGLKNWIYGRLLVAIVLFAGACTGVSPQQNYETPDATMTEFFRNALLTATYAVGSNPSQDMRSATPSPVATEAPTATSMPPTPPGTPIPLAQFQTSLLPQKVNPETYLTDTCSYLQMRWDPNNSAPGTIVVPVMFHYIWDDDKEITDNYAVSKSVFYEFMHTAQGNGFQAITAEQLAGFLNNNQKIPERSLILIVDDRHKLAYFGEFFRPYYEMWQWIVTNAWISFIPQTEKDEELWQEQVKMSNEGWVDYQAHGTVHNIPVTEFKPGQTISTDVFGTIPAEEYAYKEITTPITMFQERFGKRPIAYIWPGGGFSQLGVDIAHRNGYQMGFTVFDRGPLMFNWIPQGPEESYINDPRMVLPRFWSYAVLYQLNEILQMSEEAKTFAQQNRQSELDWYNNYCQGYPPIPAS